MNTIDKRIEIVSTGTVCGYEDYHNDFLLYGKVIGGCDYDKKQGLFIGQVDGIKKFFYGKSPKGVAFKIEKRLNLTPERKV